MPGKILGGFLAHPETAALLATADPMPRNVYHHAMVPEGKLIVLDLGQANELAAAFLAAFRAGANPSQYPAVVLFIDRLIEARR